MKRLLSSAIILIFLFSAISAQDNDTRRRQWLNEMRKTKLEYMYKELGITDAQKEQFKTTLNAMDVELDKVRRETRKLDKELEAKKSPTDLEYEKTAEAMFEFKQREATIEMKYFQKFKAFLTPRQLYLFKKAEHKWMKELMKHRKK